MIKIDNSSQNIFCRSVDSQFLKDFSATFDNPALLSMSHCVLTCVICVGAQYDEVNAPETRDPRNLISQQDEAQ